MRPRNSIRGCVRPAVRPSVCNAGRVVQTDSARVNHHASRASGETESFDVLCVGVSFNQISSWMTFQWGGGIPRCAVRGRLI